VLNSSKKKEGRVVGTAYKPNDYDLNYATKFSNYHGEIRYECDAQEAETFKGEKFDAVVFTFPRLYESCYEFREQQKKQLEAKEQEQAASVTFPAEGQGGDIKMNIDGQAESQKQGTKDGQGSADGKQTGDKNGDAQDEKDWVGASSYMGKNAETRKLEAMQYFQMNREFFLKWLANARDHLVPGGKIYIVLLPNQFEQWDLNAVCCEIGLQWCMLGEFLYPNCIYYKPKNEKGEEWSPYHPLIFSFFRPVYYPGMMAQAAPAGQEGEATAEEKSTENSEEKKTS